MYFLYTIYKINVLLIPAIYKLKVFNYHIEWKLPFCFQKWIKSGINHKNDDSNDKN